MMFAQQTAKTKVQTTSPQVKIAVCFVREYSTSSKVKGRKKRKQNPPFNCYLSNFLHLQEKKFQQFHHLFEQQWLLYH
jgi:hypothetical protein